MMPQSMCRPLTLDSTRHKNICTPLSFQCIALWHIGKSVGVFIEGRGFDPHPILCAVVMIYLEVVYDDSSILAMFGKIAINGGSNSLRNFYLETNIHTLNGIWLWLFLIDFVIPIGKPLALK